MTFDLMDFFTETPFVGTNEDNPLRRQALDLFDRCLAEGNETPLIAFIERQIIVEPPDLQLLGEIADDLQQRLMTLRTSQFHEREAVVDTFAQLGVDITPAIPANALDDYYRVQPGALITLAYKQGTPIAHDETARLVHLIEESTRTAGRLHREIEMTIQLQALLDDWIEALSVTASWRYWPQNDRRETYIH
ncbi:MAG TPA: hypothetical protein VMT34_10710 [Aggregatilineales bacterium]|nr:hypothetical protein [Aggregatilineales bacterium]